MTDLINTLLANIQADVDALPYILAQSGAAIAHTGTTAETTLVTVPLPAAAMGANGSVEIEALWSLTGTNTKTARIKFGGTSFQTTSPTTTVALAQRTSVTNRNSVSSQVGGLSGATMIGATNTGVTTASINTAASVDITITAQLGNSGESMTLESYRVIVSPQT